MGFRYLVDGSSFGRCLVRYLAYGVLIGWAHRKLKCLVLSTGSRIGDRVRNWTLYRLRVKILERIVLCMAISY